MGKYLDKFRKTERKVIDNTRNFRDKAQEIGDKKINQKTGFQDGKIRQKRDRFVGENPDNFDDEFFDDFKDDPYDVNVQQAQKPASFHHFLLENQYQDLEMDVRGYKAVYNKSTEKWEIKRRENHCFTDSEAEDILRSIQSHLSTDIKLTFYNKETFGIRFLAIYEAIKGVFKSIMEYNFGRHGSVKEQYDMKLQAFKIFVDVITRVEANYLRAIQGNENKLTHQSVQSQESLQGGRDDDFINKGYR